jgi:hypothetical protein
VKVNIKTSSPKGSAERMSRCLYHGESSLPNTQSRLPLHNNTGRYSKIGQIDPIKYERTLAAANQAAHFTCLLSLGNLKLACHVNNNNLRGASNRKFFKGTLSINLVKLLCSIYVTLTLESNHVR